jgi:YjjG family noncanonical pyrimidine nucleotidase
MKSYSCILFDLDHTLWDYEANAEETLRDLFVRFRMEELGVTSFRFFHETFRRVNLDLWDRYDRGLIGQEVIRTERFSRVFYDTGVDDVRTSLEFSARYLEELPLKKNLLPHAREILDYLHPRYPMTIITNGFDEIQTTKIKSAGIGHYFRQIVTSERAGNKKPSRQIFEFALQQTGHSSETAVMIGDNLQTDMAGAAGAGIDTIYFNPAQTPHRSQVTHEIFTLQELRRLL